ncbi:mitochondrial carrier domain-containing protein [Endogone sp. FLAS-F59071]|nr:mitochondrial carrier domain-containing protein [Endogone sp. FLAS-F59071]|eukprot:RUS21413.1 mitochondrial carrier domain-containing protein [Endogone sp. FLAS-F59071]
MANTEQTYDSYKLPPVGHALAGAIGSAIANCIVYPLDISTTRLQIEKKKAAKSGEDGQPLPEEKKHTLVGTIVHIYRKEGGLRGLYAGLASDTFATVLSNFIYFYCYSALRDVQEYRKLRAGKDPRLGIVQELFLGAEAGLISRFFTTPVGNVTTRQQAGLSSGRKGADVTMLGILRNIWNEKGITGFWTGYRASAILVSNPSLTYFFFEQIKRAFLKLRKQDQLTAFQTFLFSALSKSLATALTYPFIFTKTNMVLSESSNGNEEQKAGSGGMVDVIRLTVRREGIAGLYRGMQAQITKGFFNHGLMFMIKDRVAEMLRFLFYMVILRMAREKLGR